MLCNVQCKLIFLMGSINVRLNAYRLLFKSQVTFLKDAWENLHRCQLEKPLALNRNEWIMRYFFFLKTISIIKISSIGKMTGKWKETSTCQSLGNVLMCWKSCKSAYYFNDEIEGMTRLIIQRISKNQSFKKKNIIYPQCNMN